MPELAVELYHAAVAGAATAPVTQRAIESIDIDPGRRVLLLAFGKAAQAMSTAAVAALNRKVRPIAAGVMVTPGEAASPYPTITAMGGDHPIPGRQSFAAAAQVGQLTSGRRSTDIAIVLVSGGTSSLIAAPLRGMSEGDLARVHEMLLASGLDIAAMNAVRKRFSRWAGGRLALALAPAATWCFCVSDVPGDDPSTIGSGPCAPDPYTVDHVVELLEQSRLMARLPTSFREHLIATRRGMVPETPKRTHPAFAHVCTRVIASNRLALDAAAACARRRGIASVDVVGTPVVGDAAVRGEQLARELLTMRASLGHGSAACRLWGGETTVSLGGRAMGGESSGGRCQELALAAARVLAQAGDAAAGITLLAAGTDGRDGPTDAAGALVTRDTWPAIQARGVDPDAALVNHHSYRALDAAGALIRTGLTGTNVMDVVVGVVNT